MRSEIITTLLILISCQITSQVQLISSGKSEQWKTEQLDWKQNNGNLSPDVVINANHSFQTIDGWGGCFNERGWKALQYLPKADQKKIMKLLFSDSACAFSYCRMPIGASDYALDYYSLNDNAGDYKMEKFSIDRDRKYLLPYIKSAMEVNPTLEVWGSPWTPPAWMKENKRYNAGEINMDSKTLEAYALYLQRYVEAYRNEGVNIVAIHPQNEPLHLPKFPSCGWSGEQLNIFIRDYLGPGFKQQLPDCEIWLGTINGNDKTDEYLEYIKTVFEDKNTSQYITGAGFQWFGDAAVEEMIANFPEKKIMQTETKCGWGGNDWSYAMQTYNQMVWYLERNTSYYLQWNMVLNETGMSSWGWKQNSMITVDTYDKSYVLNPQFFIVRHFTQFVKPGAVRIGCHTKGDTQILAFKNPDGQIVCVISNQTTKEQRSSIQLGDNYFDISLAPESVCTALLNSK